MPQKYTKEFKMDAVQLYLANNKSMETIAKDLGIGKSNLGKWITQYKAEGNNSFPGKGHVVNEELRALKRELQLVRQERDILKKAIAIFSEPRSKGISL